MVLGFPKASICRTHRHWASSLFALLPDSSSFGRLLMSGGTAARPLSLSFIGIEAAARSGVYVMSNPRILVVEDEAAVALDIREKLRRLDYEVAGLASSGQEAVDKAVLQDLLDRALRDSLTGLYNRRYLEEELPREVSLARRTGTAFSLIMLDVDHFKSINDQFGHGAGDTVLAQLAKLLLNLFR